MNSVALSFVLFAAVALADTVQHRWNVVHQHCQTSPVTHVADELFDQLKRGENPKLPHNFALHANCMLVNLNLQDDQGNIIPEGVRQAAQNQFSNKAKVDQIVHDCSVSKGNREMNAMNLFGCLRKNNVNIGQL
ncbi:uncharacterized protein [Euwallacea fornicatus]|uniref:uncharacterized protein n=1 Tax=Euwallacea fornicatus TaxID=995702 RepID=UPI0033905C74